MEPPDEAEVAQTERELNFLFDLVRQKVKAAGPTLFERSDSSGSSSDEYDEIARDYSGDSSDDSGSASSPTDATGSPSQYNTETSETSDSSPDDEASETDTETETYEYGGFTSHTADDNVIDMEGGGIEDIISELTESDNDSESETDDSSGSDYRRRRKGRRGKRNSRDNRVVLRNRSKTIGEDEELEETELTVSEKKRLSHSEQLLTQHSGFSSSDSLDSEASKDDLDKIQELYGSSSDNLVAGGSSSESLDMGGSDKTLYRSDTEAGLMDGPPTVYKLLSEVQQACSWRKIAFR